MTVAKARSPESLPPFFVRTCADPPPFVTSMPGAAPDANALLSRIRRLETAVAAFTAKRPDATSPRMASSFWMLPGASPFLRRRASMDVACAGFDVSVWGSYAHLFASRGCHQILTYEKGRSFLGADTSGALRVAADIAGADVRCARCALQAPTAVRYRLRRQTASAPQAPRPRVPPPPPLPFLRRPLPLWTSRRPPPRRTPGR